VPNLHKTVLIKGSGHWTQQEKPEEVNAAMLEFLADLRK
jgi:pimeloyl-ACP methyl ester carboxylesterase